MTDFRLLYPAALLLALPIALLWWIKRRKYAVMRYSNITLVAALPISLRLQLRRFPDALHVISLTLLLFALARPQLGTTTTTMRYSGVDIVFAIDISDSMATRDMGGLTRLDAAKSVTAQFITARPSDRIAVVVFAEEARYVSPLTLRHNMLLQSLETITYASQLGMSNRSALGTGVMTAATLLRYSNAASRVVILLTDGANNAGSIPPSLAADALGALGVRLYAIGIGAITPDSDLDEPVLRSMAAHTNGRYFNAAQMQDLQDIYQQINRLERTEFSQRFTVHWQEIAPHVLLFVLVTLILEQLLRRTLFETLP